MHKTGFVLLLLLFPFILPAQDWKTFDDTAVSFTARYPSDWKNKVKEEKRVFFTSPADNEKDAFFENVNISMIRNEAFGTQLKIKDAVPSVLNKLMNTVDSFSKKSERYFTWNNNEACELVYTGKMKGYEFPVKIIQWFCFSKSRLFTATYTSEAGNTNHAETAIKILKSVVFR
jgi:hypothetical protein